ncbi:MAG: sarcosine oxidase subunit alpha family protein [Allosphingosinicella sp.]|uniref:sarcosine oxidase subunit alpha family protein n=1 Tax=Allosphingosinicella sp. TaxID=2823234 RepID=UPI003953B434
MDEDGPWRLATGGLIDRDRPLRFRFDGRAMIGRAGDTLASALLANGVRLVGRSFKYHRPRGLLGAGPEEPNALVQLGTGGRSRPNLRATEIELFDGLEAMPVNCWPSLRFDFTAINDRLSRFLPAGFYYKTFMWPDWHLYEGAIRRAAGLGRAPEGPDPDRYEHRYAHCDLLVVGGGPAGLAAALAGARQGARVFLAEQDPLLGGRLLWDEARIDGQPGLKWVADAERELRGAAEVRVLTRTTALGYFDHNELMLAEGRDPNSADSTHERAWHVRATRVVLATGSTERPLVFPGNDRPGVMLATAVRHYVGRHAVLPGRRAVIFTNNDDAYLTAEVLIRAGAEVAAVVDTRETAPHDRARPLREQGVEVVARGAVTGTAGRHALRSVQVLEQGGRARWLSADLLAMSGGFNPNVHLFCQSGGRLIYDEAKSLFRPDVSVQPETSVGGARGTLSLAAALREGHVAGGGGAQRIPSAVAGDPAVSPCWRVAGGSGKAFVDFQNDVSDADIALAARENFRSVEHLKRYTTLGMAPDQGKTSNVNALAIMAELTGRTIPGTGTTRYRFPYVPVSLGAMAGLRRGALLHPVRRLPAHARHLEAGASFEEYGGWSRPACYPRPGEGKEAAERREAAAVRQRVGLFDASPLGKIEVCGRDAGLFLDRIYANPMSSLKPGRLRYGLMLNELGVIIDDGVTARLAQDRFLVGTTGAGAARIADWLEEWLQCEWPQLDVVVAPVTEAWGVVTISGPSARALLDCIGTDFPIDAAAFPHMTMTGGRVAGIPCRVARVSFTGEVSFEISVPAHRTAELWQTLLEAGQPLGAEPAGIDAWMLLRTEKGYLHVGADTDGTTTPLDVGWERVLKRKDDFIGRRSLDRPADRRGDRLQLVGLRAQDDSMLPVGAHLGRAGDSQGFVTSSGYSECLGRGVALGMVRGGRTRLGERIPLLSGAGEVRIVDAAAYDPEGERLNG